MSSTTTSDAVTAPPSFEMVPLRLPAISRRAAAAAADAAKCSTQCSP